MGSEFIRGVALSDLPALGREHRSRYASGTPFPNIVLDDFFDPQVLRAVLAEFPDLKHKPDQRFNSPNEVKLTSRGEYRFGPTTRSFMHFLNSQPFLEFLSELTGIKALLADPYFEGGGCHEILPGGLLKVHADFDKHRATGMDRRLNVLVYLNENWCEEFGGQFELWNRDMTRCERKVLPVFNRMVVFTTTDTSYHGHPDPLTCPPDRSRRSLALYYYTVGRANADAPTKTRRPTAFVYRPDGDETALAYSQRWIKNFAPATLLREFVPPIVVKAVERMLGK
jgi:2OG-Fe(II) oxygenase superfamily